MLPELGFYLLLLATTAALLLVIVPQLGLLKKNTTLINSAWPLSYIFTISTTLSIGLLSYSFAVDDFTLEYVAAHSNSQLPTFFKVAATWGGHEGSMLFWLAALTLWTSVFCIFADKSDRLFYHVP